MYTVYQHGTNSSAVPVKVVSELFLSYSYQEIPSGFMGTLSYTNITGSST